MHKKASPRFQDLPNDTPLARILFGGLGLICCIYDGIMNQQAVSDGQANEATCRQFLDRLIGLESDSNLDDRDSFLASYVSHELDLRTLSDPWPAIEA